MQKELSHTPLGVETTNHARRNYPTALSRTTPPTPRLQGLQGKSNYI